MHSGNKINDLSGLSIVGLNSKEYDRLIARNSSSFIKYSYMMAFIIILGALIRISLSPAFVGIDDLGYLSAARVLYENNSISDIGSPLFRYRIGISYPLACFASMGILSFANYWVITIFLDVCSALLLGLSADKLFGSRIGLLTTILWLMYPMTVAQSISYMPTSFQGFSICSAIYLFIFAQRRYLLSQKLAVSFIAGVMLGLGYLVKEDTSLLVFFAFFAGIIFCRQVWVLWVSMVAGAACVFFAECVSYFFIFNDPLIRIINSSGEAAEVKGRISNIWRWDAYIHCLYLIPHRVGVYWWLTPLALFKAIFSKNRQLYWFVALLVMSFFWLQFGTGSLSNYAPLPKSPRYTILVTPFLIVLLAWWLNVCFESMKNFFWLLFTILISTALVCIAFMSIQINERTRNTSAFIYKFKEFKVDEIYTDYYSARLLNVIVGDSIKAHWFYHANFSEAAKNKDVPEVRLYKTDLAGKYVLIDLQQSKLYTSSYEIPLPDLINNPPIEWKAIWEHHAYCGFTRDVLEQLLRIIDWMPIEVIKNRVKNSVEDMIVADKVVLFKVPSTWSYSKSNK